MASGSTSSSGVVSSMGSGARVPLALGGALAAVGMLIPIAIARGGDAPPPGGEGGFAALVAALEGQPDEARRSLYAHLARSLVPQKPRDDDHSLVGLVDALAAREDWKVLDHLESVLIAAEDLHRRWWLHQAMRMQPSARTLLTQWAARDKSTLSLAPFRPGGPEELLRVVEDPKALIDDRVWAARMLEDLGDVRMLARLEALREDKTVYESGYGAPGQSSETLGKYVKRTIGAIEARVEPGMR